MLQKKILLSAFSLFYISFVSAVHLSDSNQGEVLIFPFYSVSNDLNSLITISNNTEDIKAVRLRFLEGDNAFDTFSLNIYLAPQASWVAALSSVSSTFPGFEGQPSVGIASGASSCTFPQIDNEEFLPFFMQLDDGSDELKRVRNGHIEVYEMGVVDADSDLGFSIINSATANTQCPEVTYAWFSDVWFNDPATHVSPATGGLSGSVTLVDVANGYASQSSPIAFNDFYPQNTVNHINGFDPEQLSLNNANTTSRIFTGGQLIETQWPTAYEAVSALLMHHVISNEFVTSPSINAVTEWVLTLPTKRFYDTGLELSPPFVTSFTDQFNRQCMQFFHLFSEEVAIWDRTGRQTNIFPGNATPLPGTNGPKNLCKTTSVISFNQQEFDLPDSVFAEKLSFALNARGTQEGRAALRFKDDEYLTQNGVDANTQATHIYYGLPVIGFSLMRFSNANAQPGLLAQYTTLREHQITRKIEVAVD